MKRITALVLSRHDEALFELGGYGYQLEYFLDHEPQLEHGPEDDLEKDETYVPLDTPPERKRESELLNLNARELSRVLSIARDAAKKHGDEALLPHLALFLAGILARCKWFLSRGCEATPTGTLRPIRRRASATRRSGTYLFTRYSAPM